MRLITFTLAALAALTAISAAQAQTTWEGPSGAYLNPLATTVPKGKVQGGLHYVDLQPLGSLTTLGGTYGVSDRFEVGLGQANLSVGGANKTDILHAKYLLNPLGGKKPGVGVGAVLRNGHGTPSTQDYYLTATQIFPAKRPVIASLTVRSTNGLGSGLFGKASGRSTKFGGFLGVQITPKLIPNVEYYEQADGKAWKDVGVRYLANPHTTWDVGVADLGSGLENQICLGVTHQF